MEKIGFIGIGIMGAPMAGHLLDAGYEVFTAVHRTPPSDELTSKGIQVLDSRKAVAEAADIIITIVPDTPQVEETLFGENGVAEGLSAGKLVIDMSSISPIETKVFADKIKALGCGYLDAPVSGGEVGAINASLTIMVGGEQADFDRATPVFEKMGQNVTLVGGTGVGQTTKVANQIIVALTIEAIGEAMVFATKAGADPEKVRSALMGGLASSKILEIHGERMYKRTFDPGFRIELHQKDLNLALQGAKSLGVALPNTATAQELFNTCVANGGAAWDHSAIVRALEIMSNHEVA